MKRVLLLLLVIPVLVTAVCGAEGPDVLEVPVVVYGGQPEGIMAAVASARQGVDTLLVMKREHPGGLMTYGGLNYLDLNYDKNGRNINQGLFGEWHQQVGGRVSFSIDRATEVFNKMLAEGDRLEVMRGAQLKKVEQVADDGLRLQILNQGQEYVIKPGRIIDASQHADLAVAAGVPAFNGCADIGLSGRQMAVTLVLHMKGIDWSALRREVRRQRYGPTHIDKDHAWGFGKLGQLYQPRNDNLRLRGLNIVLEGAQGNKFSTEAYINALLIFGVDPLSRDSRQSAYNQAKEEARHVLEFLQERVGGFAGAELKQFPPELYLRESRHILSRYQLTTDDLLENRIFYDTVAYASYPLDYQASGRNYPGYVLFNPEMYSIPLRSLIPVNRGDMLVVGHSSGFSSQAAASARVLPIGMNAGEGAGIAAALAFDTGIDFPELVRRRQLIEDIQAELDLVLPVQPGIQPLVADSEVFPYIKQLVSWGLLIGGYNNDFRLDQGLTEKEFAHMIVKGLKRRRAEIFYEWVPGSLETLSSQDQLTRDQASKLLLAAISKRVLEMDQDTYFRRAVEEGLVPAYIEGEVSEDRELTRKEAYIWLGSFLKKYKVRGNVRQYRGLNR
ncbi:MAG: FAD-dependent oxidoreductase [Bacillota bacterium]